MEYFGLKPINSLISNPYGTVTRAWLNNFVNKKIIFTIPFFLLTKNGFLILMNSVPNTKISSPEKTKSLVI